MQLIGIQEFRQPDDAQSTGRLCEELSALKKPIRHTARAECIELFDHRLLSRYEFV